MLLSIQINQSIIKGVEGSCFRITRHHVRMPRHGTNWWQSKCTHDFVSTEFVFLSYM